MPSHRNAASSPRPSASAGKKKRTGKRKVTDNQPRPPKKPHRKGIRPADADATTSNGRKPRHGQLNRAARRAEQFADAPKRGTWRDRGDDDRGDRSRDDRRRPDGRRRSDDRRGPRDERDRSRRYYDDDRPVRPARRAEDDRRSRYDEDRPRRRQHIAGYDDHRRQDREDRRPRRREPHYEEAVIEAPPAAPPVDREPEELSPAPLPAVSLSDDSGSTFSELGLDDRLVAGLAERGIAAPFAIQVEALPVAVTGRDVLARAATGSGKTLAFGLPMITRLSGGRRTPNQPRGIVLAPTRELAMQVIDALAPLGKSLGLRMVLVAGGMPYNKQIDALERGVDVLIATPGRLIDLMERGAADLSAVEISVLDEADQMCDMGFAPEVTRILEQTPEDGQRLLFSATLDGDVDVLATRFMTDPARISTADVTASVDSMEHRLFVVHPAQKADITAELAAKPGRTIVFVRTKMGADRVAEKMRERGVNALAIHGGLTQGVRTRALGAFRDGHVPVLVATDVAARGIHIDDVELVIQADPPAEHKTYLHRAGRTARAGESGMVVTLAMPRERRGTERLIERAGVDLRSVYVESGDAPITAITGGARPSGEPVEEYRPPVRTPQRGRHGGGRPGHRGPRPSGSRPYRPRGSRRDEHHRDRRRD